MDGLGGVAAAVEDGLEVVGVFFGRRHSAEPLLSLCWRRASPSGLEAFEVVVDLLEIRKERKEFLVGKISGKGKGKERIVTYIYQISKN